MKHLNKKIGMIGQKIVCNYLRYNKINYWTNFNDNYNKTDIIMEKDNVISFVEVSTKQFTTKNGLKVTGKNTKTFSFHRPSIFLYRRNEIPVEHVVMKIASAQDSRTQVPMFS